ncbi:MAG TPA: EipA family protein, partial [Allosphingosinicella sp.]|nr:EipA family protein [Allosphingosinicella sp.]
ALGGPAVAQVQTVDPNDSGEYEPAANQQQAPAPRPAPASEPAPAEQAPAEEYQPIAPAAEPAPATTAAPVAAGTAEARASAAVSNTVAKESVLSAAEGVFGRGAEGLAGILEDILKKQGQPTAYITGSEAGAALVFGLRYGKGKLHHQAEGDRDVYWTGPSVGFDAGGDANKVFVLVYNLDTSDALFTRFPAAEGNAYMVGGFKASYLRRGNTVLIPIRTGVGMRMGINAGYMKFSAKNNWFPF